MGKEELEVFLSSDQIEFSRLRKQLSNEICRMPFLKCTLLEETGADSVSVLDASLNAVRNSDIYVGIFGRDYSEITLREYQEATNLGKPCLTYIKNIRNRDKKLDNFINGILKNEIKYFSFRTNKELVNQLKIDLCKFIFETLEIGLKERSIKGTEAFALMLKEEKAAPIAIKSQDPLNAAELSFKNGNYLECLFSTAAVIEATLRQFLEKKGTIPNDITPSLTNLINRAQELALVNNDDIYLLRRISVYRNNAIHLGRVPDKETILGILDIARHLLKVLKSELKDEKKRETANKLWKPLPIIYFTVAQILRRVLHFPQVGWEAYNKSPYQLEVRIEVHPILGGRDLHPLPDNDINGNSAYPVEPYSPLFTNGCFTLPQVCAVSKEELILEIRATVRDINAPEKGSYRLLPQRWIYVRERNLWSYYPQQLKKR